MRRKSGCVLVLSLTAVVHCTALVRPPQRKEKEDTLTPLPRLRSWLDRPATKGAMLVLAGGFSGAIAKSATAPLERAKLMSQAGQTANFMQLMKEVRSTCRPLACTFFSVVCLCRKSVVSSLTSIPSRGAAVQVVKVEGWQGLWRGNMANVIRVVPNKGILLMCSDMFKATVAAALPGCGGATVSSIAGGLAGLTAVLLTYPLELVRTRMAYRLCDGLTCSPYTSVWCVARARRSCTRSHHASTHKGESSTAIDAHRVAFPRAAAGRR